MRKGQTKVTTKTFNEKEEKKTVACSNKQIITSKTNTSDIHFWQ